MSGSERRIDRSATAKVNPAFRVRLNLVDPGQAILDRILDRDDVHPLVGSDVNRRIQVVDFPDPVGPTTRIIP